MSRKSKARGAWLKDFVAKSRLRVSGPNCMGAYSYHEKQLAYPNTDLCKLEPGSTACLFQSGGTIMFWMRSAADRGMRFSYCVTTGNEPDLGLSDYLNFVIDDPNTKQVVLFIEGLRRPEPFMHAAARALAMGKPILAIKTGVTAKSQAASQSHTGAIAGDYEGYLAMCERYGIVNCRSLDDLVEAALAFQGGRFPKGPRIGFVTTSGGTVDLLYDYCDAEGASIPDFTDETKAALLPLMQEGIAPKNPLDVGIPSTMEVTAQWCITVANDPNIDMVAWASPMPAKDTAWGDVTPLRKILDADRQADDRFRPHHASGCGPPHRIATDHGLSVPAGPDIDRPRAQRALVLWCAAGPHAGGAAARAAERPDARDARRHARALRHRAAAVAGGCDCRRSSRGGGAHRLSGGAEDPFARHSA